MTPSILFRGKIFGFLTNASRPKNSLSAEFISVYLVLYGFSTYFIIDAIRTITTDIYERIKYKEEQNERKI